MRGAVCVLACAILSSLAAAPLAGVAGAPLPPQPKVRPAGIPAGVVKLSPCIATMGEHWADPKNLTTGPYYGVWNGALVFTELMVSKSQLDHGFGYANLRALPGYQIDHVDFEYEPHGHPGFPVPHYDIHAYYVSPAVEAQICPRGAPNPAAKPMSM